MFTGKQFNRGPSDTRAGAELKEILGEDIFKKLESGEELKPEDRKMLARKIVDDPVQTKKLHKMGLIREKNLSFVAQDKDVRLTNEQEQAVSDIINFMQTGQRAHRSGAGMFSAAFNLDFKQMEQHAKVSGIFKAIVGLGLGLTVGLAGRAAGGFMAGLSMGLFGDKGVKGDIARRKTEAILKEMIAEDTSGNLEKRR